MELSVGLTLILLGALNLTGILRRAIEWITLRRSVPACILIFYFGRWIVHTHDANGAHFVGFNFPPGMDSSVVETIGGVSHFASVDSRNRARPRRICRCGSLSADND